MAILLTAKAKEFSNCNLPDLYMGRQKEADELGEVLAAFWNYYKPKPNKIYERFILLQRRQRQGESFKTFYTDLLRLLESCSYHQNEKRKIVSDQIVMNITSDTTREKLLNEADLSLERADDIC